MLEFHGLLAPLIIPRHESERPFLAPCLPSLEHGGPRDARGPAVSSTFPLAIRFERGICAHVDTEILTRTFSSCNRLCDVNYLDKVYLWGACIFPPYIYFEQFVEQLLNLFGNLSRLIATFLADTRPYYTRWHVHVHATFDLERNSFHRLQTRATGLAKGPEGRH